jgi:hypothetical protein
MRAADMPRDFQANVILVESIMMENSTAQVDVPRQVFMLHAGKHFTHFQSIDARNDSEVRTMTGLHDNEILPDSRAILYTDGLYVVRAYGVTSADAAHHHYMRRLTVKVKT